MLLRIKKTSTILIAALCTLISISCTTNQAELKSPDGKTPNLCNKGLAGI